MTNPTSVKFGSRFIIGSVSKQDGKPASAQNRNDAISALGWNLTADVDQPGLKKFRPEIRRIQDTFAKNDVDYRLNSNMQILSTGSGNNRINLLLTGKDAEQYKRQLSEIQNRYSDVDEATFNPATGEFENPALDKATAQLKEAFFKAVASENDTRFVNITVKPNTVEPSKTNNPYDSIELDSVSFKAK